jgi:hypothetical protein
MDAGESLAATRAGQRRQRWLKFASARLFSSGNNGSRKRTTSASQPQLPHFKTPLAQDFSFAQALAQKLYSNPGFTDNC